MSSTAGAIDRLSVTGDVNNVQRQAVTAVWATGWVLLVGLALVLMVRRLSGAFIQPLGAWAVVGMAIGLEVVVIALRRMSLSTQYSVPSTSWQLPLGSQIVSLPNVVPGVAALVALASLTIPGTSALGLVVGWLVLIAGEAGQWLVYYQPNLVRGSRAGGTVIGHGSRMGSGVDCGNDFSEATRSSQSTPDPFALPVQAEEPEIPEGLVQQVRRVLDGERESIHALVRVDVAANDRLAVVHLAFCPPLATRPELTAHAMDADDAEVRITQTEAFGARVEVRLPKVKASSRNVLIEVLGSVTAQRVA